MKPWIAAIATVSILLGAAPARAEAPKPPIRVEVKDEAVEKGEVEGEGFVEYVFDAKVGQSLSIVLEADSRSCHFTLTAPGSATPIYISAITGDRYLANVRADGEHRVRVDLVRRAARKGESASYKITFKLAPVVPP